MTPDVIAEASGDWKAKLRLWVQFGLFVVFVILAITFYSLDRNGIHLGWISDSRSVAFFFFLIFASAAVFEIASLLIVGVISLQRGAPGEVKMLTGFVRVVTIIIMIIVLLYATGTLQAIGTVVGAFAGLLLGWSLQAPVSGMAAWVLVTIKRPFRVGDRVLFPSLGLNGDVLEVGLMYTKLNQVGGSIGSEEAIGRNILIPNAMLFSQVAINYTPEHTAAYFLDEVVIRLTYDSDWDAAERILINAARAVTEDIIRETGKEPYIRSDNYDYGVYMRLRFMTNAMDRPRVSHEILKRIFADFQRNPHVDFAIPYLYSYRKGMESAGRGGGIEPAIEIPIDRIVDPEETAPLSTEDLAYINRLMERIRKMGLLQPIVVRTLEDGGYELMAGRRRLKACRSLGWTSIPAIIKRGILPKFDNEV